MESGRRIVLRMSWEPIVDEYIPVIKHDRLTAHTPVTPTARV
jgi:hypothetical protein